MWPALTLSAFLVLSAPLPEESGPVDAHGDPLPERAVARLGTVRWRLGADALLVAYLPDGKSLLTVDENLTAQVWDTANGAARVGFDASGGAGVHPALVNSSWSPVALSADRTSLAALAADGVVRVFDPATGKERTKFDVKAEKGLGYRLALSPDGKRLALGGSPKPATLWDVAGGKEVGPFAPEGVAVNTSSLEFSADGKMLLQAATVGHEPGAAEKKPGTAEKILVLWDVETRKEKRRLSGLGFTLVQSHTAAAFSPDGSLMALANGNHLRIIGLADGKEVRKLREEGRTVQFADCLTFGADGKHLVALARGQSPVVFEVATGKVVARAEMARESPEVSKDGPQRNLAVSPDGKTVAFAARSVLRVIDLATAREGDLKGGHANPIVDLTFAADGKTVVTLDGDEVRAWDAATGKQVRNVTIPRGRLTTRALYPLGLSPDGNRLAEGRASQGWRLLDAADGKELQWFRRAGYSADRACRLTFSPDGKTLAIFDPSLAAGHVHLVDTATAKLEHTLKLAGETVRGLQTMRPAAVFSPDGKRLAVPLQRGGVVVYETATGKEVRSLEIEKRTHSRGSAFSPDGKHLAVDLSDGTAVVFDVEGGKASLTLGEKKVLAPAQGKSQRVAWSPDGELIARAEGARVRVYDARTGTAKGALDGHTGAVLVVAFSPCGRRLASGSVDTTALVWDLAPFREKPKEK